MEAWLKREMKLFEDHTLEAAKGFCSKISSTVDATNENEKKTGKQPWSKKRNKKDKNARIKATMKNKEEESEEHTESCPKGAQFWY